MEISEFLVTDDGRPVEVVVIKAKVARKSPSKFVKGPIPLGWLQRAAQLPGGHPLRVALALRYQSGLHKSDQIKLTAPMMEGWGLDRQGRLRALEALESVGLVKVDRAVGKSPVVVILEIFEIKE